MEQQTNVAQQSQQQKLRISGSQYPLPSQSRNDHQHLQKASSSYPECSTEYLKGYQERTGQNNIENAFHGYDNCMTSSDPYEFCSAPESQHLLLKDTGHFCSNSARCTPPSVGNIDSGESPIHVCLNIQVNASKTGKWGSGGPQIEIMNNNSFLNLPLSVNIMTSAAAAELLSAPSVRSSSFGSNGKEETMATYYPDSSIQGDTMQTLYLMNPGIPGYTDSMVSGNMVLLNNTTGGMLATHNYIGNGQPQDLIGISIPTVSPSNHSSLGGAEKPSAKQHRVSSSILTAGLAAHAYSSWQAGGTELTFLQTTDATSTNQSLCGQLNGSVKVANPSVADVSQLGMRHTSMSSIEEQHSEILNKELCLQLDQPPTATGRSQELSLRLFPQHPHTVKSHSFQNIPTDLDMNCTGIAQATSEENTYRVDESNGDGMMGTGFSNYIHNPGTGKGMLSCSTEVASFTNVVRGSKYFKAAQDLLDEIANLGKFSKCDSFKYHKSQTLFGARTDKENNFTETGEKDGAANSRTGNTIAAEKGNNPHNPEVTPAERQELQMKKAKLVAMLDEVDKKYRQYYHQIQIVVSMFESVTEVGAAKTYTSLALRTISKQFRCLRDAISGQICLASKSLGEEEVTGSLKGETSRLRFVDQHLRQQRVLQQLGMIQQNAWRPQRGLPERAVSVLRAWLFEHFLHPYPKDADKVVLARQAGLTRSQVSNWFINARVRLWKPMIEEMYIEEMKEAELGHASAREHGKNNGENKEDAKSDGGPVNSHSIQEQKHRKSMHLENGIKDGICQDQNTSLSGSLKSEHSCESMYDKIRTFSMEEASDKEDLHDVQDEGATQGQIKKARNRIEDQNYQFSSHMSTEADFKLKQSHGEDIYDKFNEGRNNTMGYSLFQNGGVLAEDNGSSASYQLGCLNRYEQDSFLTRFSGNGGVSLTLGLQQSECLSFSGTQQSCIASQGGSNELVRSSDGNCNISKNAAAHSANTYDSIGLQNRKSFSTHLMQTL